MTTIFRSDKTLEGAIERGTCLGSMKEIKRRLKYEIEAYVRGRENKMKLILLASMSVFIFLVYSFMVIGKKKTEFDIAAATLACGQSCMRFSATSYSIDPKSGACMCWLQYPKREEVK